ncbi:MAG: hypothetical protein ABIR47_15300 [Candidatus Kapaibacterium sp.]
MRPYNGARIIAALTGEMGCGTSRLLDEFCGRRELERVLTIRLRMYHDDNAGGLSLVKEPPRTSRIDSSELSVQGELECR